LQGAFRKISRVRRLTGTTRWYLSEDCLLAAKQILYTVEYRRFYLRDLESIVVWPSRLWVLRPVIPATLLGILGGLLWHWVNFTAGAIVGGLGLAGAALEVALGPTAQSRIRTTGATVDLPLATRTRRAKKVLARIDLAVRAARGVSEQPAVAVVGPQPAQTEILSSSEATPAGTPMGDLT
jgi:hypothetical protein